MIPLIAASFCIILIISLFLLDRERKVSVSWALWLPMIWLLIGGSRNISEWLQLSSPGDAADRYMEGNAVDRNVLTAMMICGIVILAGKKEKVLSILRANVPVLLFFLYCGMTILWSEYPFVGLKRWIRAIGDIVMVLLILTERDVTAATKQVLSRLGFILFPISLLFIRYFPDLGRSFGMDGSQYWTGITQGKNTLGMICLIFGLASAWRFLMAYRDGEKKYRSRRLLAHGLTVCMACWLLWIADSKTSLACFVIVIGIMVLASVSSTARKPAVLRVIIVAVVATCFSVLFLGIGGGALQAIGRNSSLTGRTDVWKLVLQFVDNPILGAGYESFWMGNRIRRISAIAPNINQAHNGYLEIYLNLGWIGIFLLAWIIVRGFRRVVASAQREQNLSLLRIGFFVVALVYNFTEGAFKMMSPVWITFLLSIMAIPARKPVKAKPSLELPEEALLPEIGIAATAANQA
jgi:exopolysaccharide production protein ExoQ